MPVSGSDAQHHPPPHPVRFPHTHLHRLRERCTTHGCVVGLVTTTAGRPPGRGAVIYNDVGVPDSAMGREQMTPFRERAFTFTTLDRNWTVPSHAGVLPHLHATLLDGGRHTTLVLVTTIYYALGSGRSWE